MCVCVCLRRRNTQLGGRLVHTRVSGQIILVLSVVLGHVRMHGVCIRVCLIVCVCNTHLILYDVVHRTTCCELLSCHVVSRVEL